MSSIRTRLLLYVCGSIMLIMILATLSLYLLMRSEILTQLDEGVLEKAKILSSLVEFEGTIVELGFSDADFASFNSLDSDWFVETFLDGVSDFRSPSLGEYDIDLAAVSPDAQAVWCKLPDAKRGRCVMLEFELEDELAGSTLTLLVARDASASLRILSRLMFVLVIVSSIALLAMAGACTIAVSKSMQSVRRVANTISAMEATHLDQRLDVHAQPAELVPIVGQFNSMLDRLRNAFEHERSFCADVAHELRTPLAGLRTTLEVTGARQRSTEQYEQAVNECRHMVLQTQELVEALLQLSRLETKQVTINLEQIDLTHLLHRIWNELEISQPLPAQVQVHWDLHADSTVRLDPAIGEIIFRNLFANARQYVDPGGKIDIQCIVYENRFTVVVRNTGCTLGREDLAKVFQRFWRANTARSNTQSHFGLGLPLALRGAEALGGTLIARVIAPNVFHIECQLPSQSPSQGSIP